MRAELDAGGVLVARSADGTVLRLPASLGRGGIRADKTEGDGATPEALMTLRRILFRADRVPVFRSTVPRSPLAPNDGWCDDPDHADYNRLISRPHPARHEALWRDDELYDVIGVLGWNDAPVVRGRGSAIFLHVARPDRGPTEGCIGLERRDLLQVLGAGLREVLVRGG